MEKNLLLMFLSFSFASFSQNPDIKRTYHWYFGEQAGLDFKDGNVTAVTNGALHTYEGTASISDTCGNLLFYTDGDTVWNYNHQVVENGTGLLGCYSSTQSSIILPMPGNDSLFYIFTTDCGENNFLNGLRYSINNVKENGGLGKIIPKNILLYSPSTEKLSATKHNNGEDFWIVSHEWNSSKFYSYRLSSTGLNTLPVISEIGVNGPMWGDGAMTISSDGNLIASGYHLANNYLVDTVEIYSFDKETGQISNPLSIPQDTTDEVYGICFSPDNSKLYATTYNSNGDLINHVWQYDLKNLIVDSIINSKKSIFSSENYWFYYLQIGADNRIYIAQEGTTNSDSLSVINSPDSLGGKSAFSLNQLYLNGRKCLAGLPNFPNSFFYANSAPYICSISTNKNHYCVNNIFLFPNPASKYLTVNLYENSSNFSFSLYNLKNEVVSINKIITFDMSVIIDISYLSNGLHILKIINNETNLHSIIKFMKN